MTAALPRKAQPVALRPSMSASAAMQLALREALSQILANAPGAAKGEDPEFLHQLRVGARRMRAALRASRRLWRKGDVRALRRHLRALAAVSGPARDWDVQLPRLAPRLRAKARRHRRAAHRALARALPQLAHWRLPRVARHPAPALPQFARGTLERMDRRLLRRARRLDWSDPASRHALRIRLRRLRYVAEFLAGAFPRGDSRPLLRSLKRLQALLGELNDAEVERRLLAELGAPGAATSRRERSLLARLPDAWRQFAGAPRFWRRIVP